MDNRNEGVELAVTTEGHPIYRGIEQIADALGSLRWYELRDATVHGGVFNGCAALGAPLDGLSVVCDEGETIRPEDLRDALATHDSHARRFVGCYDDSQQIVWEVWLVA